MHLSKFIWLLTFNGVIRMIAVRATANEIICVTV